MKINGKHQVRASRQEIWDVLMDTDKLAKITPGVDRLEPLEIQDRFQAVAEVKVGPVKGNFSGEVHLKEKNEPRDFVLSIDQKSKIGNAKADISIELIEEGEGATEIHYTGDVLLSGVLARMGQRVIGGVISMMSKQFFQALAEEVANDNVGEDA